MGSIIGWLVTVKNVKSLKLIVIAMKIQKNIEKYRKYNSEYNNQYYYTNKNKVIIIQKRYYYNKLPLDKKEKYKKKLQEKYPDIVNQICV